MIGTSTQSQDQAQEDYTANDEHLDTGQPELELAKYPDAKVVDEDNDDEKYGDEHAGVDFVAGLPVLYDQSGSRELVRRGDKILEEVGIPK